MYRVSRCVEVLSRPQSKSCRVHVFMDYNHPSVIKLLCAICIQLPSQVYRCLNIALGVKKISKFLGLRTVTKPVLSLGFDLWVENFLGREEC